jgi:hypothetical protein
MLNPVEQNIASLGHNRLDESARELAEFSERSLGASTD